MFIIPIICRQFTILPGLFSVDYFAGCLVDEINMNVIGRRSIERIVHSAINVNERTEKDSLKPSSSDFVVTVKLV